MAPPSTAPPAEPQQLPPHLACPTPIQAPTSHAPHPSRLPWHFSWNSAFPIRLMTRRSAYKRGAKVEDGQKR
eukprot:366560-Chlamydomonas_euryale.AAC.12